MHRFFEKNKFIILLLLAVFFLRLPSLFEPYWYGDEGVYLTLGLGIKRGLLLYRDIFDNKPPLIYLIAAAANGTMFWFRGLLNISILLTIYFFYRLAQYFFLPKEKVARLTTGTFALLTTARLIEGNVANSEMFILLPTIVGFWLGLTKIETDKKKVLQYLSVGLVFALGFLLKIPAVFDFLALLGFWVFFQNSKKTINLSKREFFSTVGYFFPIFLMSVFFWAKGAFLLFFESVFVQTMGYVSSWETGSHSFSLLNLIKGDLGLKTLFVFLFVSFLWVKRKSLDKKVVLLSLWFALSLFAATLSARPYPHYLIQAIPPLCLSLGYFLIKKPRKTIFFPLFFLLITIIAVFKYRFWHYPTFSYWQNFAEFVVGKKEKTAYFSYFDSETPKIYSLAEDIDGLTSSDERIFLWSDNPSLYALSKRLPATAYTTAYHVVDLNRHDEVISLLQQQPPPLIIVDQKTNRFPQLERLLANNYIKILTKDGFGVFSKRIY